MIAGVGGARAIVRDKPLRVVIAGAGGARAIVGDKPLCVVIAGVGGARAIVRDKPLRVGQATAVGIAHFFCKNVNLTKVTKKV